MNVRETFFFSVYNNVKAGKDIMIVSSDIGAPGLDDFRKDFPNRFVNVGIAEQNSISVSAGIAIAGKIAISYGLNPFPVTRGFDQIRNIMASLQIPITLTALKAGTATAEAGFSHMVLENVSLLRTLRNVFIVTPSDNTISSCLSEEIIRNPRPRYVQFDPYIADEMYDMNEIDFDQGFVVTGSEKPVAVITYGIWANRIKKSDLNVRLIDCFSLPVDKDKMLSELRGCKKIITVEEGIDSGGIGSMMLELLNDNELHIPLKRMALRFENGYPEQLMNREDIDVKEGLTMEALKKEIVC